MVAMAANNESSKAREMTAPAARRSEARAANTMIHRGIGEPLATALGSCDIKKVLQSLENELRERVDKFPRVTLTLLLCKRQPLPC